MITWFGRGIGGAAGCVIGAVLGVVLVLIAVLWLVGSCVSAVQKSTAALAPAPGMPTIAPALAPSQPPSIQQLQDRGCARIGGTVVSSFRTVTYGGRRYMVLLDLGGNVEPGDPLDCTQAVNPGSRWHTDTQVCELP